MDQTRRKRGQVLHLKTVGVDNTLKTQQRHDLSANIRVFVETEVVEKHPESKTLVPVGVVRQHNPVTLAKVQPLANQYHGLFAGGRGANAPLMMVEIVDLPLNVDERLALGRARG